MSNLNEIDMFLHCARCIKEVEETEGESPASYSDYSIGWTPKGLQVWCERHNCNIVNIDFEGHQHPADTTRLENKLRLVKG